MTLNIADVLLNWFDQHGRKHLPWQQNRDSYRIWVSEIMLQQTQAQTVVPYFERFIKQFPTIEKLSAAPIDAVLHQWTGLGYYARARNLHRTAQQVVNEYQSTLPSNLEALCALPGIGRSTAGAILAFAYQQRHPILDGNVKRVLTRLIRLHGHTAQKKIEQKLWTLADQLTPQHRVAEYTQAIMDLGATVCTRKGPACQLCPLHTDCQAYIHGDQEAYPTPKAKAAKPVKNTVMLMIYNPKGQILLQRRPPTGIWGGLWSFPELDELSTTDHLIKQTQTQLGLCVTPEATWPVRRHTLTHFHLDITPQPLYTKGLSHATSHSVMDNKNQIWYHLEDQSTELGLSAPIQRLLEQMKAYFQTTSPGNLQSSA